MSEDHQSSLQQQLQGVTYDPRRLRWKARIHFAGQERYIGRYKSNVEAALAYDQAARLINAVALACPDAAADTYSMRRRNRQLNFPDLVPNDPAVASRLQAIVAAALPEAAAAAKAAIGAAAAAEAAALADAGAPQLTDIAQLAAEQLANGLAAAPANSDASAAAAGLTRAQSGVSAANGERSVSPGADSAAPADTSEGASGADAAAEEVAGGAADAGAAAPADAPAAPAAASGKKAAATTKKRGRAKGAPRASQRKRPAAARAAALAAPAAPEDTDARTGHTGATEGTPEQAEGMEVDPSCAAAAAAAADAARSAAAAAAAAEAAVAAGSAETGVSDKAAAAAAAEDVPLLLQQPQEQAASPAMQPPVSQSALQQLAVEELPGAPAAAAASAAAATAAEAAAAAAATPAAFDTCIESTDWESLMALIGVGDQLPPDPLSMALPSLPLALGQPGSGLGLGLGSIGQPAGPMSQPLAAAMGAAGAEAMAQLPQLPPQQQLQLVEPPHHHQQQQQPRQQAPAALLQVAADDLLGNCMLVETCSAELQGSSDSSKPSCTPVPAGFGELPPLFAPQPLLRMQAQHQQQPQQMPTAFGRYPSSTAGVARPLGAPTLLPAETVDLLAAAPARAGSNSSTSTGFVPTSLGSLQAPLAAPWLLSSPMVGGSSFGSSSGQQQRTLWDANNPSMFGAPPNSSYSGMPGATRELLLPPLVPQQQLPRTGLFGGSSQPSLATLCSSQQQQPPMHRKLSLQLPKLLDVSRCGGPGLSSGPQGSAALGSSLMPPIRVFPGGLPAGQSAAGAAGGMAASGLDASTAGQWSEGPFAAMAAVAYPGPSTGLGVPTCSRAASAPAAAAMPYPAPFGGLCSGAAPPPAPAAASSWAAAAVAGGAAGAAGQHEGLLSCISTSAQALAVTGSCLHALTDLELHVLQQPRNIGAVGAMLDWLQAAWHREVVSSQALPLTAGPAAVAAAAAVAKAGQPCAEQPGHMSLLMLDRLMLLVAQALAPSTADTAMQRGFLLEVLAHLQQGLSEVQDVIVVHGGQAALCRDYLVAWGSSRAAACSSTAVAGVVERLVRML